LGFPRLGSSGFSHRISIGNHHKLLPPFQHPSSQSNSLRYPVSSKNMPCPRLNVLPCDKPDNITPAKQWILTNALGGFQELTEHMIGILSVLCCIPDKVITTNLLENGWRTKVTAMGIRYYRTNESGICEDSSWHPSPREQSRGD